MSRVIADAACLVGLERVGRLALLTETFADVVVPSAVAEEFGRVPEGIGVDDPENHSLVQSLSEDLGAGESEVIALAEERPGSLVILDDGQARREARNRGVLMTGTMGVLIRAKRRGHIAQVRPLVDALVEAGFRLSDSLYERTLEEAGER